MNLSVLNVVPIRQGQTYAQAFDAMVRLAQKVEEIGYCRYWVAEHHNTKGFGSSATALLIQHILANTKTIRAGAGGVMLPNHSPYIIAEYYGTLETLYPGRVDLGLGRAPGTDRNTAQAIRRTNNFESHFPDEVAELEGYFKDVWDVHAYPAAGLDVPLYILGTSTESAWLAAEMGLPYAFASHFAPAMMEEAIRIYRSNFKPSEYLDDPYVIIGVNVTAADTDEEARRLDTTRLQGYLGIVLNRREGLLPPMVSEKEVWNHLTEEVQTIPHFGPVAFNIQSLIHDVKTAVEQMGACSLVGSPKTIARQYLELKEKVNFDEMMVNTFIYDEEAQFHSFELLKQTIQSIPTNLMLT